MAKAAVEAGDALPNPEFSLTKAGGTMMVEDSIQSEKQIDPDLRTESPRGAPIRSIGHGLEMSRALKLLAEARHFAEQFGCDLWQFAVEWRHFRDAGISISELRYLLLRGFIAQADEVTEANEELRRFRSVYGHRISRRAAFILTPEGWSWWRPCCGSSEADASTEPHYSASPRVVRALRSVPPRAERERQPRRMVEVPRWDSVRRELCVGKDVVKRFKLPCANQETILAAFQEEGWPPRIDDPLPPQLNHDPKQRLRDTLRSLNRNQKIRRLVFKGDGTGQGVLWEPYSEGVELNE